MAINERDYEFCEDASKGPWVQKLKEIYQAHAIFTESYDRQACFAEIQRVALEYGENVCY